MARKPQQPLDRAGQIIQDRIDKLGMTQLEVADASGIGAGTISHIVTGKRRRMETVLKLLAFLGLVFADVFPGELEPVFQKQVEDKIVGVVRNSDIMLIEDFVMAHHEPSRVAANIRFLCEREIDGFREWVKKRTAPGCSEGGPEDCIVIGP